MKMNMRKVLFCVYLIIAVFDAIIVVNLIDKKYIAFQEAIITEVKSAEEKKTAEAEKKAAEAEKKAAEAEKKAAEAEKKTAEAEKKTAEAEKKAAEAEKKAAKAEKKAAEAEAKVAERASMTYGDAGHLLIEDVDISVDLYKISGYNIDYAQGVVDRWNSAGLYSDYDLQNVIADHSNQEFGALKRVSPGSIARILYEDGSESRYQCVSVDYDGHNTEDSIRDSSWHAIDGLDGYLYMFTCNSTWESITITCWNPL